MFLIGDPHLGREFVANVPLDRRGEREAMMMTEFERLLNFSDDTTVVVGDLFDRPVVAIQTLYATLNVILAAALNRPNRKIIIIAGNHDLNKATDVKGSFHVLAFALERIPNVHVLLQPRMIDGVAYFPWQYERTAEEQVNGLDPTNCHAAVGHWDLESFGDHNDHLAPTKLLKDRGINRIYSGHWHIAGVYVVDCVPVTCTGSMQPLTHAEDPKEKMYVTLTKAKYEEKDPDYWRDYYVRVRATKGEEVTPPPTCLGFKVEYSADTGGTESERVNLGDFDLDRILKDTFESKHVKPDVVTFIKEKLSGLA